MAKRRVFLSSTVKDLSTERRDLKTWMEGGRPVSVDCLISEGADFPVTPAFSRSSTYEIALSNLDTCDYVVQILKRRYGVPDIEDGGELISITHMEYRRAFAARKPVFSLVDADLWDLYWSRDRLREEALDIDPNLFRVVEELADSASKRRRWVTQVSGLDDMRRHLDVSLFGFDESTFVRDVNVPDGTTFRVDVGFDKTWRIRNAGMVPWRGRYLEVQNPNMTLFALTPRVPIPETLPGEEAEVTVRIQTGHYPGDARLDWKMVDERGRLIFPDKYPL